MRVVVDANIVIAALFRPDAWTAQELRRTDVDFLVPQAIEVALAKHGPSLMIRAGCSREQWERRVSELLQRVSVIPTKSAEAHLHAPLVEAVRQVDPEDAVYVASTLAAEADFLWTRDATLLRVVPTRAVAVVP